MAKVNAVLQMMIENALKDLYIKTGADMVIVDDATGETLATRISALAANIAKCNTATEVDTKINTAINNLVAGAPAALDTLKEIADYIANDTSITEALQTAIGNKVDKVSGKGLSTNDFTAALLTKLNGIQAEATKTAKSSTNGNIIINGTETVVYTHPNTAGNKHIPAGGSAGKVLRYGGAGGTAAWGDNVRSGASAPNDLAAGELFVKLITT